MGLVGSYQIDHARLFATGLGALRLLGSDRKSIFALHDR
jgi:hypothetical protein